MKRDRGDDEEEMKLDVKNDNKSRIIFSNLSATHNKHNTHTHTHTQHTVKSLTIRKDT